MSDDYKLQVSIKTPAGTMVNIRANDGDELAAGIRQTTDSLPGITELEALAGAVQTVNNAFSVPKGSFDGTAPVGTPNYPGPAQAQQQAPAAVPGRWVPDGGIPVCEHGPFVYNSGNKNGVVWEGYFCPAQKGDPSQHKPVFKPRQGWGK